MTGYSDTHEVTGYTVTLSQHEGTGYTVTLSQHEVTGYTVTLSEVTGTCGCVL